LEDEHDDTSDAEGCCEEGGGCQSDDEQPVALLLDPFDTLVDEFLHGQIHTYCIMMSILKIVAGTIY
jgi:hypothetical protein